jgi:aminocarboxymuconate-semialdehyde decarboxylase
MSTFDIHNHGFPKHFLDAVRRGEGERHGIRLVADGKGEVLVRPDGLSYDVQPKRSDHDAQLKELNAAGIDAIALSVLPYFRFFSMGEELAVWASRTINDGLADVQKRYPGRIYGMGMVPLPYGKAAATELTRLTEELGLKSVLVLSNVEGRDMDDPEFLPFFQRAEELQTTILFHPDSTGAFGRMENYWLRNLIGNPMDTTMTVATLIFGGVLEKFPHLKLVFSHGGGAAPCLVGRWRNGHASRPEPREKFSGSIDDMFARLYFDALVYEPKVFKYLVDFAGPDHLLLGTDYSGPMTDLRQVARIREDQDLTAPQRDQILGGNAHRLLGI